jgi:hypothetical protein
VSHGVLGALLVLVAGRPWERIDDVRAVRLVIQAGRVVVDRR